MLFFDNPNYLKSSFLKYFIFETQAKNKLLKDFHKLLKKTIIFENRLNFEMLEEKEYGFDFRGDFKQTQFLLLEMNNNCFWLFSTENKFGLSEIEGRTKVINFLTKMKTDKAIDAYLFDDLTGAIYRFWNKKDIIAIGGLGFDQGVEDLYYNMVPIARQFKRPLTEEELNILKNDFYLEISPSDIKTNSYHGKNLQIKNFYHIIEDTKKGNNCDFRPI